MGCPLYGDFLWKARIVVEDHGGHAMGRTSQEPVNPMWTEIELTVSTFPKGSSGREDSGGLCNSPCYLLNYQGVHPVYDRWYSVHGINATEQFFWESPQPPMDMYRIPATARYTTLVQGTSTQIFDLALNPMESSKHAIKTNDNPHNSLTIVWIISM